MIIAEWKAPVVVNNRHRNPISKRLRKRLQEANAGVCCVCKTRWVGLNFHHIDLKPANNDPGNIAVLCVREHDTHHRPSQYHLELSAEKIAQCKRDWESFVDEAKQPHPQVLATINAYGSVDEIHSVKLSLQRVGHGIAFERIYHLLHGPMSRWIDEIFDELTWLGAGIQVALVDQPLPIEYCPADGHAFTRTINSNFATKLVLPNWNERSACGVYINSAQPSLAIRISYQDTDIENASIHKCGKYLHFHCEAFDERIPIRPRPSIRSQVQRIVEKFVQDWSPGTILYGTGNQDKPVIIERLDLPPVWER